MVSTIDETLKHAMFLAKHLHNCDLKCTTIAVLLELGISTRWSGFDYLERAILIYSEDPTQTFIKEVYPAVGESYKRHVGVMYIEASIRRAIKDAWQRRDNTVWSYYFPVDDYGNVIKPTSSEFIALISRFLELVEGCKEGYNESK